MRLGPPGSAVSVARPVRSRGPKGAGKCLTSPKSISRLPCQLVTVTGTSRCLAAISSISRKSRADRWSGRGPRASRRGLAGSLRPAW